MKARKETDCPTEGQEDPHVKVATYKDINGNSNGDEHSHCRKKKSHDCWYKQSYLGQC